MLPYSIAPRPGPSREVSARPRDAADLSPPTAPARLGYRFDPAPEALHDQVRAGWLKPVDVTVLVEMIRWARRRGRRDSCWCSRQVVARAIGRAPRTVQSSWGRLRARGFLESVPVGPSDPVDPANRTGWRHHFAWLTRGLPAPGPAEAPPPRRPRGRPRRVSPEGGGRNSFLPPRRNSFLPRDQR